VCQVLESTPSPSRVATPPASTTPDITVAATSSTVTSAPSPADNNADTCAPTPTAKRPRLRSTKSELFLVSSELSRDAADTADSPRNTPAVSQTVTASLDDSVDSCPVGDTSHDNSVADISDINSVANDRSSSSAGAAAEVCDM